MSIRSSKIHAPVGSCSFIKRNVWRAQNVTLKLLKFVLGGGFDPLAPQRRCPCTPTGGGHPDPPSTNVEPPTCHTVGPARRQVGT